MKRITLILCLLLVITLAVSGCDPKGTVDRNNQIDPPANNNIAKTDDLDNNKDSDNTDQTGSTNYEGAIGEIIKFDGENIHILFGDIADIFKVKPEVAKNFYVGESVKLSKDGKYFNLKAYLDKDFAVKHTNMGDPITSITGTIKEDVKGKEFIVVVGDNEYNFENYEDIYFLKGTNVTVEYTQFSGSEEMILIAVYNNDATLQLVVDSIERTDDGKMVLNTKSNGDSETVDYIVYVLGSTAVEFNHSEVKEGSLIMVYASTIRESFPAQVDAQRILLGIIK